MPVTHHQGADLWWDESGSGDPLLLIMGLGYTHDMWYRVRPMLEPHFRVIFFDNRGVGRSSVPPGPYSIPLLASDAAAVLTAAGAAQAHVVGISMGGMIAQEFALAYPERVRKLVLGCTTCGYLTAVQASPLVQERLRQRATMTPEEGAWLMAPHLYDPRTPRERVAEDIAVRVRTYPTPHGYLAQVAAVMAWNACDRIRAIQAPALVIHGESDEMVPAANAAVIHKAIPGSRLVMLKDASHIFFTDQPEAIRAALLNFLRA
ncbi:MAG: alpha/beta hydrolase, partial [Bryobacteraceae bacterium]|nr:alpha/beta hydrolase [Bryobacteraceae bacterium]